MDKIEPTLNKVMVGNDDVLVLSLLIQNGDRSTWLRL